MGDDADEGRGEPDAAAGVADGGWGEAGDEEEPVALEISQQLPPTGADDYLVLLPGGEFEIVPALPKPRRLPKAVVYHAGEIFLCEGKRRAAVRTPGRTTEVDDADVPLATRLVLVLIEYRAVPPRSRRRRYLIATNADEELLGWIDHSPPGWEFPETALRALCELAGLECATERYEIETAFESAHPGWVT